MEPFVWTPQLSIGVDEIDEDHKKLIIILNMAIESMNHPENDGIEFANIFEKMSIYTQHHFHREEALMKACNYPHTDNHKSVHALLIKEINHKNKIFKKGKLSAEDLVEFLLNWLIDHIADSDAVIAEYCEGKSELIKNTLEHMPMDDI